MSVIFNNPTIRRGGIVKDGLVLNLDAADTFSYPRTGTRWNDLSGNGNHGTLTNGPTFDNGNSGNFILDGIDDKIDCGNSNVSVNNLIAMSGIVWFNKTGNSSGGFTPRLLTKRSAAQNSGWWDFLSAHNTHILQFNADFGTVDIVRDTSITLSLNQWYMGAFTWDGSDISTNIKIYVNGIESSYSGPGTNGTGGRVSETTNRLVIGNADWASRPFYGKIAIAQLYNRVLNADEIYQNFEVYRSRFGI